MQASGLQLAHSCPLIFIIFTLSYPSFFFVPSEASCTWACTCQTICPISMQHSPIPNNQPQLTQQSRSVHNSSGICPLKDSPGEEACMSLWNSLFGQRTVGSNYRDSGLEVESQYSKWACPFGPIDTSLCGEKYSQRRARVGFSKIWPLGQGLLPGSKDILLT